MERLLTVQEAAEQLNTTPRFVRRLTHERRIRFVHLGRLVRFPVSAVEEFVAAGMVAPTVRRSHRAA